MGADIEVMCSHLLLLIRSHSETASYLCVLLLLRQIFHRLMISLLLSIIPL